MHRFYVAALALGQCLLAVPAIPAKPPNILFILADDLGWKDVGYQGAKYAKTPSIDRLAADGMAFTSAYSGGGNCAPSRACLLSGTYTPRHGVFAVNSTERGPKRRMRLRPIPNKSGLAADMTTLAEALKRAGYATGIFGKWHLDGPQGASPSEQGFDVVFDSRKSDPNSDRGVTEDPKGIFSLTGAACEFIEANQAQPFFCYLSHHAIHSALEARAETLAQVKAAHPELSPQQALYHACTQDLDAGVAQVLAKLDELNLATETVVIFTSDNGATPQSSQEPLRGAKGTYYEAGIRIPAVVRWPKVVSPGGTCDTPITHVDWFPTCLAMAAAERPANMELDGENLISLLTRTGSLNRQAIYWHFPGYLDGPAPRGRDQVFRTRPVSVIRKGDWKLHLNHEEWVLDGGAANLAANEAVELYNLKTDVGERHNVSREEPERREELLSELNRWLAETAAPLPKSPNPRYNAEAPLKKRRKSARITTPS